MIQGLKFYIMTGLVVLLGVAVEAQALVPLMPQDHPLCREVLQREKRDYEYAQYFDRDGWKLAFQGGITFSDLALDSRCKGFMDGPIPVSNFQIYRDPDNSAEYFIFAARALSLGPFSDKGYYEHELYKIDRETCKPERLHLGLSTQTPLPYFMGYAVYKGETYGIYTARHEKVNEEIESWVLDYEGQKIIQNLSRADGKTMVCRH